MSGRITTFYIIYQGAQGCHTFDLLAFAPSYFLYSDVQFAVAIFYFAQPFCLPVNHLVCLKNLAHTPHQMSYMLGNSLTLCKARCDQTKMVYMFLCDGKRMGLKLNGFLYACPSVVAVVHCFFLGVFLLCLHAASSRREHG